MSRATAAGGAPGRPTRRAGAEGVAIGGVTGGLRVRRAVDAAATGRATGHIGTIGAGIMEAICRITSGIASGGVLTDRVQHLRGPILASSIGLVGFGYLIIGVFPNYYVILIALGFAAAYGSIWHPPALGIISQRFPARRGYYISLHRSAGNVGETVVPTARQGREQGSQQTKGLSSALVALTWEWPVSDGARRQARPIGEQFGPVQAAVRDVYRK